MSALKAPNGLPASSAALLIVGCCMVAWFALMPRKKRMRALFIIDRMLSPYGPVGNVIALRPREDEPEVRESFAKATAWWDRFKPLILTKAEEYADD